MERVYYNEEADSAYAPRSQGPLDAFSDWRKGRIAKTNAEIDAVSGLGVSQPKAAPTNTGRPAFEDLPQASYSNEGRVSAKGPLPITFHTAQQPAAEPSQDVSKFNWQDMAKQLASMSQGLSMGLPAAPQQMGGWNSLTDHAAELNAAFDRRHMADNLPRGISDRERARLMVSLQNNYDNNATARDGHQLSYNAQMAGQGVTARGQDMNYNAQLAGQGVTSRGQDMNAAAHLATAAMASEDRRANNRDTIEANAPYRESQVEANKASAAYNQQRIKELERDTKRAADPHRQFLDERKSIKEMVDSGIFTADEARQRLLELEAGYRAHMRKSSAVQGKANGGLVGYADGGPVETPEQVMARIQAKYGVSGNTPQPAPQQPQPQAQQPVRQSAYPQPQPSMMDRLRAVATGGLERRMQGYADGGSVFGDNSQAGLEKRLAAMQSMNNGASVEEAYGGVPTFGQWNFDPTAVLGDREYGNYNTRNFANGGPIAVGGRQVLGPGTGKSDSIPAVIDGEQPAALSTGEFVMPVEAVQHFGLDRLNKMVAQARKGLDTGRGQA